MLNNYEYIVSENYKIVVQEKTDSFGKVFVDIRKWLKWDGMIGFKPMSGKGICVELDNLKKILPMLIEIVKNNEK